MYKEQWVLVRKSDGTPHEFSRCLPGRVEEEVAAWLEDESDNFQVEVEAVECQDAAVAQELAKVRINVFFNRKEIKSETQKQEKAT